MNTKSHIALYGAIFALFAAMANASIGTFSKILMLHGLSPALIAFSKTLIGACLLILLTPLIGQRSPGKWIHMGICAFFGIFVMYIFETKAYSIETAANVVVALMGSACITAIVFGRLLLKEQVQLTTVVGAIFAICGLGVVAGISFNSDISYAGTLLGILAGAGYGIFSVLMKRFQLEGGLMLTRQILIFGSLYLFIPVSFELPLNISFSYPVLIGLLGLAIVPTIFGFYCTTKAIQHLSPAKVQIIELSEPIFAAIIAMLFLREFPGVATYVGGSLIILGIAMANGLLNPLFKARTAQLYVPGHQGDA